MSTTTERKPKAKRVLPYFGSAAAVAHLVGPHLAGCRFVAVPFAGGMSELLHIDAGTILVSDLNRHAMNLANVLKHPQEGPRLIRRLRREPFHEDALREAQERCACLSAAETPDREEWARDYFVACWCGRNGSAGTGKELSAGMSFRWDGNGGDSAGRFRTATESLKGWRRVMHRCTFLVRDCFELLEGVKDEPETGIYVDPPWPLDGERYAHKFTDEQQRRLADVLTKYTRARVVVRYGDHPLVRQLYPARRWDWHEVKGRTANARAMGSKAEVLIVNRRGE